MLLSLLLLLFLILNLFASKSLGSSYLDAFDHIELLGSRIRYLYFVKLLLLLIVLDPTDTTLFFVVLFVLFRQCSPILLDYFHDLLRVEFWVCLLYGSSCILAVENERRQRPFRCLARGLRLYLTLLV